MCGRVAVGELLECAGAGRDFGPRGSVSVPQLLLGLRRAGAGRHVVAGAAGPRSQGSSAGGHRGGPRHHEPSRRAQRPPLRGSPFQKRASQVIT